jgi:hypothetical protein
MRGSAYRTCTACHRPAWEAITFSRQANGEPRDQAGISWPGRLASIWIAHPARDWYLGYCSKDPKPFAWTKSADEILQAIAEYCQRVTSSGQ